jgi:hypothetical protein
LGKRDYNSDLNFAFWFHLFITILAWVGPFLFSWYLMLTAYAIVSLQFIFFGRCLLNKSHGLKDENNATFYSVLFDMAGIKHNPAKLKFWVRRFFYPGLGLFTLLLQLVLGWQPLLF